MGGLLPVVTNTVKGLMEKTMLYSVSSEKKIKLNHLYESYVYNPSVLLIYAMKDGNSSFYVATLSGFKNGLTEFKLLSGPNILLKLYKKINSSGYNEFILEIPINATADVEVKCKANINVVITTESTDSWTLIS